MEDTEKKSLQSVKLVDGGVKGIVVVYGSSEVRNGVRYYNEHSVKHRAPVSEEMVEKFKELKPYMLSICGYVGNEREMKNMAQNLSINGVTYNDKGVVLSGQINVLAGNKVVALNTPLITDGNEYSDFVQVINILDNLFKETQMYIDGSRTPSMVQIAMKFADKNPEIDKEAIKAMSDTELIAFVMPLLDKAGHCIILNTDVSEDKEEDKDSSSEALGGSAEQIENQAVTPDSKIITEKAEVTVEPSFGDEEDFSIDIKAPVIVKSTAKLIGQ